MAWCDRLARNGCLFCCLCVLALAGCKKKVPECTGGIDQDGDGYGRGCLAGEDCNDFDATINVDCCDVGNYQGCACDDNGATESCFEGPADALGTGECMGGTRTCSRGEWSACVGQVIPQPEICNEVDDDCDGTDDNGVLSACGNCLPGCDDIDYGGTDPIPDTSDNPNIDTDGVNVNDDGDIVLDQTSFENVYLWIANDPQGTVSKIDTRTGQEVARYATVVLDSRLVNHVGRAPEAWNSGRNKPSRTAIDFRGDVWVGNRAHNDNVNGPHQPSVTKIYNDIDDCVDRNGNMTIETSTDANGDGRINTNQAAVPREFYGENDECIAMTVAVGNDGAIARAVAISAPTSLGHPGNVWVGMYSERAFYELDGVTGALVQRVPQNGGFSSPNVFPYGAAIDGQGRLWSVSFSQPGTTTVMIDTTKKPAPHSTFTMGGLEGGYGITVDLAGRIWAAMYDNGQVKRYTPGANPPTTGVLDVFDVSNNGRTRGVGIDTRGNVWVSVDSGTHRMLRVNADSGAVTGEYPIANGVPNDNGSTGTGPIGIGVDFDGNVWTANRGVDSVTRLHIDQNTGEPANNPLTGNQMDTFKSTGPDPYTYSDFTGLSARIVTNPGGSYAIPIQGCAGVRSDWSQVSWDATVPAGTSLEVYVRVSDNFDDLDTAPAYGPWTTSPADLDKPPVGPVPNSNFLRLEFHLATTNQSTPVIRAFDVQWGCEPDAE